MTGWREPAGAVPLRYGSYPVRYRLSLAMLWAGGIALQFTSAYTLPIAVLGFAASIAGWIIVPSAGWRRIIAIGPGLLGVAAMLAGTQGAALSALAVAGWLLVRMRPARSYVVVILPAGLAIALAGVFPQYGNGTIVAGVIGAAVLASTWAAYGLATTKRGRPQPARPPRPAGSRATERSALRERRTPSSPDIGSSP
ncbi:hypothetical protein [Marisediminicola senii]|uniref:hypothetical protein n=1 Tax=Marisediminicola senii TaxID=2711233 RepID=UPI0013EA1B8A|nr:hypothetical protein [Marisediminicola senii]